MNQHRGSDRPASLTPDGDSYEQWFDGLLGADEAAAMAQRVAQDPALAAQHRADLEIEASLRRSFGGGRSAGPRLWGFAPSAAPEASRFLARRRTAAAAALLVIGATAWLATRDQAPIQGPLPGVGQGRSPVLAGGQRPPFPAHGVPATGRPTPVSSQCTLGDVFLDALAVEFQPLLGCKLQDDWNRDLLARLETAPCNRDEGVVVLGEWADPRVDVANMVLLRRGENPIMLVVPNCELEADLCVAKNSGLYVHRGLREGRPIYEVSPLPRSAVLACVDATQVVTQQQL